MYYRTLGAILRLSLPECQLGLGHVTLGQINENRCCGIVNQARVHNDPWVLGEHLEWLDSVFGRPCTRIQSCNPVLCYHCVSTAGAGALHGSDTVRQWQIHAQAASCTSNVAGDTFT